MMSFNDLSWSWVGAGGILLVAVCYLLFERWRLRARLRDARNQLEREIAEHRHTQDQLHQLLFFDPLTGLANRALFRDRLRQAVEEARRRKNRVAVIFLDLDWSRVVSDTFGQDAEDELMIVVAERLKQTLRSTDTICRLGSREFTVILPHSGEAFDIADVAQRILERCNQVIELSGGRIFVRPRIGIALTPRDTVDPDELLRFAAAAVHVLKARGRHDYAFYDSQLTAETVERLAMEAEIRDSIDKGHLTLYYQPIVDLTSGLAIGVEALVRLNHPIKGLIAAGEFIPLAEETGWVTGIGAWVIEEACRQVQAWQLSGLSHLRLTVNVSSRLLEQESFVERIDGILERTGLPPASLELEVTEYLLMDDVVRNQTILAELRDRQIRISVDDFGTGYSALSYLSSFPIDTLKIDRALIKDAPNDRGAGEVTRAIIAMAAGLQVQVIAEGIERSEQVDFLREKGCQLGQGFLIAAPGPPETIQPYLDGSRPTGTTGTTGTTVSAVAN